MPPTSEMEATVVVLSSVGAVTWPLTIHVAVGHNECYTLDYSLAYDAT